jgi:hypothetical protein
VLNQNLIGHDAGDEEVAMRSGLSQEIEVSDVKEIIGTGRVTDSDNGSDVLP